MFCTILQCEIPVLCLKISLLGSVDNAKEYYEFEPSIGYSPTACTVRICFITAVFDSGPLFDFASFQMHRLTSLCCTCEIKFVCTIVSKRLFIKYMSLTFEYVPQKHNFT